MKNSQEISFDKIVLITIVLVVSVILLGKLWSMYSADQKYNLGKGYTSLSRPIEANTALNEAITLNPDEPTFYDELAQNEATIAVLVNEKYKDGSQSATVNRYLNLAITHTNQATNISPQSLPFWKSQAKIYYTLSLIDPRYISYSLNAIETAARLAPTEARVWYNYGLIAKTSGNNKLGIEIMKKTLQMKPDYYDVKKWLEENDK